MYDPLASLRTADGPEFDLFLCGTVFLDIIFTDMAAMPTSGTEVMAEGMGSSPGGIANLAIASSRLGLARPRWRRHSATTSTATSAGGRSLSRSTSTWAVRGGSTNGIHQ